MPDYKAKFRPKKGEEVKEIKIFAPCYSDAEQELRQQIKRGGEIISIVRSDDLPRK